MSGGGGKVFKGKKMPGQLGGALCQNTVLSARNIPGVKAYAPNGLNIYDIVNTGKLFLTQEAVKKIEEVLA